MNQNLLIVDDEYDILKWLEELFKFDFDMEVGVYTAENAIEALKLLDSVKFDVVLTDIRMPGMDGITLYEKIKDNWPRCKTVFLTGFRNFDDIYKAVRNKDVRFVLKSEEDEVIMRVVRDVLQELLCELEREKVPKLTGEELKKAEYWIRKSFVDRIFRGEMNSEEDMGEFVAKYGIPVSFSEPFFMILIRIDDEQRLTQTTEKVPNNILEYFEAVRRLIQMNLPEDIRLYIHPDEQQTAWMFIQPAAEKKRVWQSLFTIAQNALEYAQEVFQKEYGSGFSAVLSSTPTSVSEIGDMNIKQKQIMVGYLGGERAVIAHLEKMQMEQKGDVEISGIHQIPQLKLNLELSRRQEYFKLLSECCAELLQNKSRHDSLALELYYSISIMLLQFINQNQLNKKMAFEIGLYKLTKVDEHESWTEAVQYLFDVSAAVFKLLGKNENTLSEKALKRVTEYIDANLGEDLSLTQLAGIGGFNASYLSRLFKHVHQVNITEYIYQKRMELAGRLLTTTGLKIQEIAVKTGYISSHSFARSFRGWYGVSPGEYREANRKNR